MSYEDRWCIADDDASIRQAVVFINRAFSDVADRFDLMADRHRTHGAHMDFGVLKSEICRGLKLVVLHDPETGEKCGAIGIEKTGDTHFEISRVCVAPEFRGRGYGKEIMLAGEAYIQKHFDLSDRAATLSLGCIYEDKRALSLYRALDYKTTRVKRFKKHPFSIAFMEKTI